MFSETNFVSVRGRYLTLYLAAAMMNADSARRDADPRVVAESALCCPSADGSGCELELSFTEEEANNEASGVGRRLLAAASEGKRFVVAYECEGTGGDVCDLQRTGYDVPRLGASPPAADETDDDDDAVSAAAATAASLALASVVALSALA